MADRALFITYRTAARAVGLAAASLLLFVSSASASTHTYKVSSTKDVAGHCGKNCTLREAVMAADVAGGNSTIIVPKGVYKLTIKATSTGDPTDNPAVGDLDINAGVHLTIKGAGSAKTILNANYVDRMFAVQEHASLVLAGVTVENGDQPLVPPSSSSISPGDGGTFFNDGRLSITKCVIKNSSSYDDGGAIYSYSDAALTSVTDSTMTGNNADDPGAALYVLGGNIVLTGDTFEDNAAFEKGGVLFGSGVGSVTISHTTMEFNTGDDHGGAVYLTGAGKISISHSRLSQNGAASSGGAMYIENSGAVSIGHSTFSQNAAYENGGAIYLDDSTPTSITDSSFSSNSSEDDDAGGAIYDDGSSRLTVSGSSFTADAASVGGAISMDGANLTVHSSHFTNNSAEDAGAILVDGSSDTATQSITTSTFEGNSSTNGNAGAIDDERGALTISASTFYRNGTGDLGGALMYESNDAMSLVNDTFDSNRAGEGGALYLSTYATVGEIVLRNDTVAHNTAYLGGGIYAPDYANTIVNTIVADNVGEPGRGPTSGDTEANGDCAYPFDWELFDDEFEGTTDAGHNLDSDGSCLTYPGSHAAAGDKTANPKLGPLRNNGGPVPTDALLSGSPAIGAANKSQCPSTDARGDKRGSKCDIGAYQTEPKPKPKKKKK